MYSLVTKSPTFHLLNGENNDRHFSSPRTSPSGTTLIFLENQLSSYTSFPKLSRGPNNRSRRLKRVPWAATFQSHRKKTPIDADAVTVVDSRADAMQLADGTHFYGLYPPTVTLPQRMFSADGSVVYLSSQQMSEIRLLAVDLDTGEVALHDDRGLLLLDVHDDVILSSVVHISAPAAVVVGRVHTDYLVTTESPSTTEPPTTTMDPCDQLTQELEILGITNITVVSVENSTTTTAPSTTITTAGPKTTLLLPRVIFAEVHSIPSPANISKFEVLHFDSPSFTPTKPSFNQSIGKTFFSAWLASPSTSTSDLLFGGTNKPLLVYLKYGPYMSVPATHSRWLDAILTAGMSILVINHRGSQGAGDRSMEALTGNAAQVGKIT